MPIWESLAIAAAIALGATAAYVGVVVVAESDAHLRQQQVRSELIDRKAQQVVLEYEQGWAKRLSQ